MIILQVILIMMAIFGGAFVFLIALYTLGVALERFAIGKEARDVWREDL